MLTAITAEDARTSSTDTEGGPIRHANYIGANDSEARGPQAYRNTFVPGYVIEPHFHSVDQYQIFVTGNARIGKHALDPVTVHYADAFTPYGPIVVQDQEMSFFNLRSRADTGAHWMPGSSEEMKRRAGRSKSVKGRLQLDESAGPMTLQTLIQPTPDGLLAVESVAGPGEFLVDSVAGGSGCYQLIVAGSLEMNNSQLGMYSVAFASPGESFAGRQAGPEGVHLLELQLPAN